MKKLICSVLTIGMVLGCLVGCGSTDNGTGSTDSSAAGAATEAAASTDGAAEESNASGSDFDWSKSIAVNSREDGSGTRSAFVELFGVEEADADGNKIDNTTVEAIITNSTSVMMTGVSGDPYAIGYVSLGSLNETVKALQIDGAEATTDNVANGSYKVSRPFNIATLGEGSEAAQDFINFIMSADGQAVIAEEGYIQVADGEAFTSSGVSGSLSIGGSSSVYPVMEKLTEAYAAVNPNVKIELQQTDSSTGMTSTVDGSYDIGMASRELKDSETESGLTATTIALDGIAVIVNNENPVEGLTAEQVKAIYTGEFTSWSDVQ